MKRIGHEWHSRILRAVLRGGTLCLLLLSLFACRPQPEEVVVLQEPAPIYPDYREVTIPYNIAPLNFLLRAEAEALHAVVRGAGDSLVVSGRREICFPLEAWRELLERAKGGRLTVSLSARRAGQWVRYPDFHWQVAAEPLDAYLTYRLIEPGYEVWNAIRICERRVENFEERVLADNNLLGGSCMNCHIHGGRQGEYSLFHLRGPHGGSLLNRAGRLRKLNLKAEGMPAAATYGGLHPSGRYGVFSSNVILPAYHAAGIRRLEVYDTASDLLIVDFDRMQALRAPQVEAPEVLETFPTFSADGRSVYYCAARKVALPDSVTSLRYSLCRIAFDPEMGAWGERADTLWQAEREGGSVCFPKASPDGRYLLFTVADYGTFPIWHTETDLRMMDLQTGRVDPLARVNSDRSDTYCSWSSNSRWFVFASKREDGQYGKPYFVYVDEEGHAGKPFLLPQASPSQDDRTFKSYNIPDLSPTPVPFGAEEVRHLYEKVAAEPLRKGAGRQETADESINKE